jgi:hypothetical protein
MPTYQFLTFPGITSADRAIQNIITKKLDFPATFVETVTDVTKNLQPGAPAGQVCVDSE